MRCVLPAVLIAIVSVPLAAQTSTRPAAKAAPAAASAAPGAITDLPVRKVVLYKNGVGYFEHAGAVNGDQRVAIDFTSSQLNDVLQSLTALDSKGGKVSAVSYNSTTPIEQRLDSLSLGLKEDADTPNIYETLRGQRVEVTGAGAALTGRLVNVEDRPETDKNGNTSDHYYLIVESDDGALRTAELSDALSVHMLDPSLEKQFASYLEIIGSAHSQEGRHLTLEDRGEGQRQLQVGYISEVPVWKSTYRIVFPREAGADATVQGWAVVDNTVGVDWNNVQLSLVAGAPQSFIQPLSEPIYTRRPEIPIAIAAQTTPQTHEAAEAVGGGAISGTVTDLTGAAIPGATVTATSQATNAAVTRTASSDGSFTISGLAPGLYTLNVMARGFQTYLQRDVGVGAQTATTVNVSLNIGSEAETVTVQAAGRNRNIAGLMALAPGAAGPGSGGGIGSGSGAGFGGGVYRASDAIQQGDVSTNAFDDFFEYAIAQPVTIHKNESAMVPILQQDLPAEHVTLWSARDSRPLRAIWLENKSNLTLDAGSFSIFENGEFAGEGLLDPIHPGEKRLLSYASDQAVKVASSLVAQTHMLRHVAMHQGVLLETTDEVKGTNYTISNGAGEARTVIVEHTRVKGATLESDTKPVETTPSIYRFKVVVDPHQSTELHVSERSTIQQQIVINPDNEQTGLLIETAKFTPQLAAQLKPLIDAETALNGLNDKLDENDQKQKALADDEARDRENVTALKGNDASKRFVDELNQAEDQLQAARKDQTDLEKQRDAAQAQLDSIIAKLAFDADLDVATPSTN